MLKKTTYSFLYCAHDRNMRYNGITLSKSVHLLNFGNFNNDKTSNGCNIIIVISEMLGLPCQFLS